MMTVHDYTRRESVFRIGGFPSETSHPHPASGTLRRMSDAPPKIALFVTCLVNLFRPQAGFAAVQLLQDAGCEVIVPEAQTCCGQPPYNNGDTDAARDIARDVIELLEGYDYVIVPSGSCAGMLVEHYPRLFDAAPDWGARATALAARTRELTQFLADDLGLADLAFTPPSEPTALHDSCSARRELGVLAQPRRLLGDKVDLRELADAESCCGFGGTFCVKFPEISERMVTDKCAAIAQSGAQTLVSGDLGCLLNIAGRMSREGRNVRVFHIAELLIGATDGPGIGAS